MRIVTLASTALVLTRGIAAAYGACPAATVEAAFARWGSYAPAHYTFTIEERDGMTFSLADGIPVPRSARVEIRNSKVASMSYARDEGPTFRLGSQVPRKVWKHVKATPLAIFEQVRSSIAWAARDKGHIIDCQFDDVTGMLVKLHTDSESLSDSFYVLEIIDFRVVP